MTTRSTSASAASALRSGVSAPKRAATTLERTISEALPDSDVAMASGRLNARKSVSGSGRRTRNGRTTRRVSACARLGVAPRVHAASMARSSSAIASADAGPFRGLLGHRPANHTVHRGHRGRAGERRRLLVLRRVQDFDDGAAVERRTSGEHLEEDCARGEEIAARVDRLAGRPARAPCSAACPSRSRCASVRPSGRAIRPAPAARGRSRAASRRGRSGRRWTASGRDGRSRARAARRARPACPDRSAPPPRRSTVRAAAARPALRLRGAPSR